MRMAVRTISRSSSRATQHTENLLLLVSDERTRQMGHIKQSVAWWCFAQGDMTIERLVQAAAEIGYEAIELVEEEHWQLIKDHGLAIASMRGQSSLKEGFNRREHHDHLEREVRANIALAAQWGIPNIIVFSGKIGRAHV